MATTQKFTSILFKLPDGRIVLQRRTKDVPYGAGMLGIFGGWVEEGETVRECLIREIKEETSLDVDTLNIISLADFVLPASKDFGKDRHFYLYECNVDSLDFAVYEGDGAEAFTLSEISERSDLIAPAKHALDNIIKSLSL